MIHISYGMVKSASTLTYQLIEAILHHGGRNPVILRPPLRPALSVTNYFDDIDMALIRRVQQAAGTRDVVLKTHQRPAPDVLAMVEQGELHASASFRDPREIALSMVDHGRRSRRWAIPEFSECRTVYDCCPAIDQQSETLRIWCSIPQVERIAYNDICFDMPSVIARLSARMGVCGDADAVERTFADTRIIGQFNKGVPNRYHEMSAAESDHFLDRYAPFYDDFMPDPCPSEQTAPSQEASGQLRQIAIDLRRLWHNRAMPAHQHAFPHASPSQAMPERSR